MLLEARVGDEALTGGRRPCRRGHNDAAASIDDYCHPSMVENPWAALERKLVTVERKQGAAKSAGLSLHPGANLGSAFAEEMQVCLGLRVLTEPLHVA